MFFVNLTPYDYGALIFYTLNASLLMSLVGIITGVWAEKFDHLQTVVNFVILPLSFLSGTFYSIKQLPEFFYIVSQYNPFFYMIDGMRYGFTGYADGDIIKGAVFLVVLNIMLWLTTHQILARGWRLKN